MDHVNLQMEPFTLKSIIGPNGAGKTTFFNMMTGQYKPTEGKVFLKGKGYYRSERRRRGHKLGMGRSFQLTNIFPLSPCWKTCGSPSSPAKGFGLNFWRNYLHFSKVEDEAYAILKDVLLDEKWAVRSAALTHGEQRKLEIAILLALEPEILFLDEPTAGMGQEEVPAILEILQRIKDARDRTMLLVEHKMDMIMTLSDTIMVLQEGRLIADGDPDEIYKSEAVQEAYLGGGTKRE